jgi:hypothetical protein
MPVVSTPSSVDIFSWAYEPGTGFLRGEWAGPLPLRELPTCYGQLLVAAEAHDCRFWLLDMRRRNWHDAAFAEWFSQVFVAQASRAVGQPLFLACLVPPGWRSQVEGQCNEQLLRRIIDYNVFPFYFTEEQPARAWLHDQRTADVRPRRPVAPTESL